MQRRVKNYFSSEFVYICLFTFVLSAAPLAVVAKGSETLPNVIIILADDMGYGDLSSYGHPTIKTPNLDRLAYEGQKWTNFYAAAPACSASRAGLLTGRLPVRSGMASSKHRVFFPNSTGGLQESEYTLAELFKERGYQTKFIGKWHLGHLPQFLPFNHGFDSWFGIPYSNDMNRTQQAKERIAADKKRGVFPSRFWYDAKSSDFEIPLMDGKEILEVSPEQSRLTQRYTRLAKRFIESNQESPFFLFLSHSMPHIPLFASKDFRGTSSAGLYGDVIEEMDASVGEILETLHRTGLHENTLIIFTSDNGPWTQYKTLGGSAGLLRGGKSTTWEGGMRVPAIFWGASIVRAGIVHDIGSSLDFLSTFAELIDIDLPEKQFDSYNLLPRLTAGEPVSAVAEGQRSNNRKNLFYYSGAKLAAIRSGTYKAHFHSFSDGKKALQENNPPLLFNLSEDPGEQYNIAAGHPNIIRLMQNIKRKHSQSLEEVENQLNRR